MRFISIISFGKNNNFSETNIDNRFYAENQTNYFDKINQYKILF